MKIKSIEQILIIVINSSEYSSKYPQQQIKQHMQLANQTTFQKSFELCSTLQKKLKDEYLLLMTQQDQKANFEKKLMTSLNNFYRNFVHYDLSYKNTVTDDGVNSNTNKRLFQDEGFGDCYIFVKDSILTLSKNPQLCLALIKKHNNWGNIQSFSGVAKVMTNSMFQNIVDDQLANKDILYFMDGILDMIVASNNHFYDYIFSQKGLVYYILREFMRKPQFRSYSNQVAKGTLLQIAKVDHLIDFKSQGEQDSKSLTIKKQISSHKRISDLQKPKLTPFKSINTSDKITSKVQIYCQALKQKDSLIKTSTSIRTKNRHCASNDLLRFLGIIQNINFPTFTCTQIETQLKEQQRINQQWSMLLMKKDSHRNDASPDISLMKNLVFTFFGDLFKMLYSMPLIIRVICKILYQKLIAKYDGNKKNCLTVIGNFIITYWICQSIKFDDALFQSGKISDFTNQNTSIMRKAIAAVIKGDYNLVNQSFHVQFNLIISNLKISVFNYLSELVNVQLPAYKLMKQPNQIKSHSVCLSIADIDRFIKMIQNCPEEQINKINDKILKKIKKIQQISSGTQIFGSRKDKSTGKQYKNSQSYVLFSQVIFPKDLSFDYMKYHNEAFKNNKLKNVLKQVLLNIGDLHDYYEFPTDCQDLYEFFNHILKTRQERLNLNSIDRIPVELKIKYLLSVSRIQFTLQKIIPQLIQETQQRLIYFKQVWDKSKQYFLKAISSIIAQNQKISFNENSMKVEIKKKKLDEFMAKAKVNVCLTSPKTRQKQIVLKTNVREISEQEKDKIWLENQSKCIHTALNLDFIKSLTGQPEKIKNKYQSHISSPNKFAQIFCSLPEVKQTGMSGEDTVGIQQILAHFIDYCIQMIKKQDANYKILVENHSWLQQNLEQKMSKKMYDKLYPKYPTFKDLAFYMRLKTLDWIDYDHLKIDKTMRVQGMWDIAAKILKQVEKMKTASQKLDCILECNKIIVKSYNLVGDVGSAISADDIYPIVIYILIKAAPRRLISNLNFIEMYANRNKLMSRNGYFFTQLKSAVLYCENLSHEDVGMGMIEFNKKIYEKQIEYGIYFMMGRRKNSPRTISRKIDYLKDHYFKKPQTQQKDVKQNLKPSKQEKQQAK